MNFIGKPTTKTENYHETTPKGRISSSTPDFGSIFLGESGFGHPRAWGEPKMFKNGPHTFSQKRSNITKVCLCDFQNLKIAKVYVYVFFLVDTLRAHRHQSRPSRRAATESPRIRARPRWRRPRRRQARRRSCCRRGTSWSFSYGQGQFSDAGRVQPSRRVPSRKRAQLQEEGTLREHPGRNPS